MANMAMVKMFGHDFGPARTGVDYHRFERQYNPVARTALPRTYGPDAGSVEMRFLTKSHIRTLGIGLPGIEFLKGALVAEITVSETIEQEYARRALSLLSNNFDVLMAARSEHYGVGGFLTTDHTECADFSKGAASAFSDRLVGGLRGLSICRYDFIEDSERYLRSKRRSEPSAEIRDHHMALKIDDTRVVDLFAQLGLKPPQDVHPNLSVAQFDIVSIFKNGAVYTDLIQLPFEFLEAEPV